MDGQILDRWTEKLLDIGKTNNLVSFRDTKASTAEIVYPEASAILEKANGAMTFEVFDPQLDNEYEDDLGEKAEIDGDEQRYDKDSYREEYISRIRKSNQILVYNKSLKPMAALRNVYKKAKVSIEETGVNTAYMALGFIRWKESENSGITAAAPILLIPISIERESQIEPYYIKLTGEDISLNPIFQYKLSAEYDIRLPEYNDEPLDDYLNTIRSIVSKLSWSVTDECKIGIFSFQKINMYNDLKKNKDAILKNANVRKLLGESVLTEHDYQEVIPEYKVKNPIIELHSVVDADSSQIEAIQMAKAGASFVIQGPPGTGKSQTITNIISECLYDGKKVLFVSEKQAALNVVFDKLKKAGLSDYCLELHSHKANKKTIIEELCRTLREGVKVVSSKADDEISTKKKRLEQLDGYEEELHRHRDVIDMSLYQLFEHYYACGNAEDVDIPISGFENTDKNAFGMIVNHLEEYIDFSDTIGFDFRKNAWYGFKGADGSYQSVNSVKRILEGIVSTFTKLSSICENLQTQYSINVASISDLVNVNKFFRLLSRTDIITPAILMAKDPDLFVNKMNIMANEGREIIRLIEEIEKEYDNSVMSITAETAYTYLNVCCSKPFKRLFDFEYRKIVSEMRKYSINKKRIPYKKALSDLNSISECKKSKKKFDEDDKIAKTVFGKAYQGLNTDWDDAIKQLEELKEFSLERPDYGVFDEINKDEFAERKSDLTRCSDDIEGCLSELLPVLSEFNGLFDNEIIDLEKIPIDHLIDRCTRCIDETDMIPNWVSFDRLRKEIINDHSYEFVMYVISNNLPVDELVVLYKKTFYRHWIESIIGKSRILTDFSRVTQDQAIRVFSQKDIEQFEISKAQISAKLSNKRPKVDFIAEGSPISILLHEETKKRKQKSIRKILSETAEVVQLIKPCFLMSPLSISTYLDSDSIRFDVVVFDEASQIQPQDAIGAIYRAKQSIIVGDSMQMPPSNFFNASIENDDDEEDDVSDYESILDKCQTIMPQRRLCWHYRSRCEQLISFSNKNFYHNSLITFPSATTKENEFGLEYYHVDGLFDRKSKTNLVEAERVVRLIVENIEKHPERSLGVVAFSLSQANLIERLVERYRQENPQYEGYFKETSAEPFFVKNLETVQGDERDTIIFSIAYGKGTDGRLLNNFGPLNRNGGERRLNVAVSRARKNVQVVSSMHYTDLDLKGSSSLGASLLREYLDFAENGDVALERNIDVNQYDHFDSDFEMDVCDFLRNSGYDVDTQVGCSSFKIDLALKRSGTSNYLLAIECDGATYHSSKNARDRDRLRQSVLESMGWKFYRIWSTDWFKNNQTEKKRLLTAVESAIDDFKTIDSNKKMEQSRPPKKNIFEQNIPKKQLRFDDYKMVDTDKYKMMVEAGYLRFQNILLEVLKEEAPLSEEWFLQRICYKFQYRTKVTTVVREEYNRLMVGAERRGIERKNGFLYLKGENIFFRKTAKGDDPRDIKHISLEELATGLYIVLKENRTASKKSLYKFICEQLGYARIGNAITERLDKALDLIKYNIEENGDTISLIDRTE